MKLPIVPLRIPFWIVLASMWFDSAPAYSSDAGLDLVLLVDISGSMYSRDDRIPREGSDWQRLRWDAVKLRST